MLFLIIATLGSSVAPRSSVKINGLAIEGAAEALSQTLGAESGQFDLAATLAFNTDQAYTPVKYVLRTPTVDDANEICAALVAPATCVRVLTAIFPGVVVSATLPELSGLVGAFRVKIEVAEAEMAMTTVAVQTSPPWGLDRVDQPSLPLDQQYDHPGAAGGAGVSVFVIDTGVRCTHNDLAGRCVRGWGADYAGNVCPAGVSDCSNDGNGHGSHCAGTVAGTTYGVAKAASIVAVQVLGADGSGSSVDVFGGMDWVVQQKINDQNDTSMVASMSLGAAGISSAYRVALEAMTAAGIAVSVAAGNSNADACGFSPAYVPSAITVGSTTNSDARSSFSNYGSCVDIYAPGSGILSLGISSDSATATLSGTSMACPHVSGALALIHSRNTGSPLTVAQATATLLADAAANVVTDSLTSPNLFLQTREMTQQPTAAGETWGPTGSPVAAPTSAPTEIPDVHQGPIACGDSRSLNTGNTGNVRGNPSNDATYHFDVAETASITFSTCEGSSFDTFMRIYDANFAAELGFLDDSCSLQQSITRTYAPGRYNVMIEGFGAADGEFTLTMVCAGPAEPTLAPTTPAPTSPTTPAPTVSPTVAPELDQGPIACGATVTGDTGAPGASLRGNAANDHYYSFTVDHEEAVTFNTCGSAFDTYLRIYTTDFSAEVLACDDCGDCGVQTVLTATLPSGDYVLLVEGYSAQDGVYTLNMTTATECSGSAAPSTAPTHAPTAPTPAPAPTFVQPTASPSTCGSPSDYHDVTNGVVGAPVETLMAGKESTIRAIYGADSRKDNADVSACWQQIGRSTVPLVRPSAVAGDVWGNCGILSDRYACSDGLQFGDQSTCGFCSGTLIAPNKIATAGHCISSANDCSNTKVVFGATNDTMIAGNAIPASTVYSCASVERSVVENGGDWAVFTLDRAVPASVASPVAVGNRQMSTGTGLMMIGHPSGLPTKYADNATINSITNAGTDSLYYSTDLDAFGGNSGSGVFTTGFAANEATGQCYAAAIMVGILVRGRSDYGSDGCPVRYPQGEAGEDISGALTLLPYAESQRDTGTPIDCGGGGEPSPPPNSAPSSSAPTPAPAPNNSPTPALTRPPSNPTPLPTVATTEAPDGCTDNHTDCQLWAELGYCVGEHADFMHTECRVSCVMCTGFEHETPPLNPGATDPPTPAPSPAPSPVPSPSPTDVPTDPPTNSPTNPSCHYTECGRSGRCSEQATCAVDGVLHEVRCCSDTEIDGWKSPTGACSVWGESDDTSAGWSCTSSVSFSQAKSICEGAGARLCTAEELQQDCTAGTGCSHDRDQIWSSTTAETAGVFAMDIAPQTSTEEPSGTGEETETAGSSGSASSEESSGVSDGAIAAAIIGTLFVVGLLIAVAVVAKQQRQEQGPTTIKNPETEMSNLVSQPALSINRRMSLAVTVGDTV